jgi:hypothetical protein
LASGPAWELNEITQSGGNAVEDISGGSG